MAKVTITIEDKGAKTVSFLTEIEGDEIVSSPATPAMAMGMATRAMFDNGMLAQAAAAALDGIARGERPTDVLTAFYALNKNKEGE